jgi:hypothetical protein
MRHVAAPEPFSAGRRGLEPQDTWQHMIARPAPYLGLALVCMVPDLQGTDSDIY